ncbi:MAG: 2-C-methyl-D-erythritol 4-phosphate cytidylyltransferase [Candidatus Adiutrix sp.]|jgi:2-C-methyl-D-erythritol 4-phosphate cytidylyltransferase/2-C-methyl-D-erythritol 2,4-cyclodiphosphate synthase|nr:2-C-methyl-D-erythritol 4-phosphate cytidylyltransferase [Candidatus Adiutrix sp.]
MPATDANISAVVVAGGLGRRFGGERPKQLALLAGRPVLTHTLAAFERAPVAETVLVLPGDWREVMEREAVRPFGFRKVKIVTGGATRAESTRLGFAGARGELILIHDGVRPFVTAELIAAVAAAAAEHGAALAAVPVRDTLKEVAAGRARRTLDRAGLWQAQTPQGFRREILARALAAGADQAATDDTALLEPLGLTAAVVPGSPRNLKITTPEDLALAETLLAAVAGPVRTGHGYDLHRLIPGRPLFLGGLEIPFEAGLLGHSDADVLAHALGDALLGAAALGDIGGHFPDRDPQWAGLSGARLLAETMAKVRAAGFELVNADLTLIGEKPKIAPYRPAMIAALAEALRVPPGLINVKATTTEGLEATGRGLALAAWATATLRPVQPGSGSEYH